MDEQKISAVWPGWKVVRKIGNGNYGCVYEVERNQFGTVEKAAVKVLTIPQDHSVIDEMHSDGYDDVSISKRMDDELEEMVKEYYLMLKLKGHTNVVNCDDLQYKKHSDGLGYDVFVRMELLTPLNKVVKTGLKAEKLETMVLKLGKDICHVLEQCEKNNIVYLDVRPNNIFLSEDGDYKLGDCFGKVRAMGNIRMGINKYMAPEVYQGGAYEYSANIYSLGLVMYWLLNENRMPFLPFPPTVPTAFMENQANEKRYGGASLPAPRNGSTALKMIVCKACAYEPKERFASAGKMLKALDEVGRGNTYMDYQAEKADNVVFHEKGFIDVIDFNAKVKAPGDYIGYACGCDVLISQNGQVEIRSYNGKDVLECFSVLSIIRARYRVSLHPDFIQDVMVMTANKRFKIRFEKTGDKSRFWDALTTIYDNLKIIERI